MRFRLLLFGVVALSIPLAGSAAGQTAPDQPARRGDGGLHVSGGGVVGYVGGSGSISGNVVGPGGAQNTATRPAVSDSESNAVLGGEVAPPQKPAHEVDTGVEQTASKRSGLPIPIVVLIGVALLALVVRRPVQARFSR
jgi:hypothetical protein